MRVSSVFVIFCLFACFASSFAAPVSVKNINPEGGMDKLGSPSRRWTVGRWLQYLGASQARLRPRRSMGPWIINETRKRRNNNHRHNNRGSHRRGSHHRGSHHRGSHHRGSHHMVPTLVGDKVDERSAEARNP
ncbi:hypothetical protein F5148DRAFT_504032 [Russula earlei]|uniref:Uncharacterized protein n=1 Tax=Russula earlei TaxID=71964 RepID=A0ACC0TXA5_9AGAM|nr:hypothetical protein F5148DRAFT_504032 [Russula earlei]